MEERESCLPKDARDRQDCRTGRIACPPHTMKELVDFLAKSLG
jgi:hypothetical protein